MTVPIMSIMVPTTIPINPAADFLFSVSLKTMNENSIITNMLSLSIGTTMLAGPS
jgi:hypothetical protein